MWKLTSRNNNNDVYTFTHHPRRQKKETIKIDGGYTKNIIIKQKHAHSTVT